MNKIFEKFDAIYVINMDTRPDRMDQFRTECERMGLPHEAVTRFSGQIPPDGKPSYYGFLCSHMGVLKDAKAKGHKRILVFEDDALFVGKTEELEKIASEIDTPWQLFYLGYNSHKPLDLHEDCSNILRIRRCYATHAMAYDESIYDFILNAFEKDEITIYYDVWLDRVIQKKMVALGAYPLQFSQQAGMSDLQGKKVNYNFIVTRAAKNTAHLRQPAGLL